MALTTTQKTEAYQFFIVAFGAATGVEYMNQLNDAYNAGMTTKQIVNVYTTKPQFEALYPRFDTNEQFAERLIENVVGASATAAAKTEAKADVAAALNAGWTKGDVVFQIFTNLAAKAPTDAQWGNTSLMLANKVAVAQYITETLLVNTTDLAKLGSYIASVTEVAATVDAAKLAAQGANGQTFTLTTGTDTFTGTSGNDTFTANVAAVIDPATGNQNNVDTAQAVDTLNGGAGIDTLNLTTKGGAGALALPSLNSVEVINAQSLGALTIDTSAVAGVTNLNVTKVGVAGAVKATGATTTDVNVSMKAAGAQVEALGGKDVTVKLTDVAGNNTNKIAVGDVVATGSVNAPKGNVVVEATAKAADTVGTNITMGDIAVTGGKTISVTQKAGANNLVADGAAGGGTTTTHTMGAVTVTANGDTTTVTLKQDAAATAKNVKAVTGATEVASVKFTKLDANESVTISGLTFTAAKDLTAEQVAAAFANLSASAIKPTDVTPTTATGDTNGGSASANGKFTGSLLADWTSGAATGDTVVFTGKANTAMTDLAPSAKATVTTTTQGVTAVSAQNTLGVANGTVTIAGAAALKTVTVDGYAASTNLAGITGGTNTALDTISLANGGNFEIDSAAATLGLTLTNVNGTVDVQAGTKTLNAAVSHAKAADTAALVSASAETVNVTGTGNVAGNTTTTGLKAATAINTTGMTAGNATFTIANGTTTSYTGGAGKDAVTVSNANVAITKAIGLGAGDDTLTLNVASGTVAVPTIDLKGGEGVDTIAMNGESAAALSANGTFAGKIEGFEKLSITDTVAAARTVNMANMDGITHVVSNGSAASGAVVGQKQIYSFDIAGLKLDTGGTLSAGGALLYTAGANDQTASTIAAVLTTPVTLNGVSYVVANPSGTLVTLTSATNVAPQPAITVATGGGAAIETDITNKGVTLVQPGIAPVAGGTTYLTIDKLANNGTLELVDTAGTNFAGAGSAGAIVKMADATGSTDSLNIVTKVDAFAGTVAFGTVDAAGVETLKLNAVDTSPVNATGVATINTGSLTVKADKATSLTIEGNSNVTLTLDAATTKLATIDAGTLTGALNVGNTLNAVAMTITGGKGNDVLKASVGTVGTNEAKADVLNGGDGNDTLYAGSNGAKLSGGDGNDLFIVTANSATVGNKESNTYSEILDFKAGDLLQLQASNTAGNAAIDVTAFTKLAASLNESTAVFSDFVNAAIKEAGAGAATWFNYKGDAYVVIDSATDSTGDVFKNGEDLIVKLTGINGDNLSWNSDYATVALI